MKPKYHFKNFTPEQWSKHQRKTHSTTSFKIKQSEAIKAAHRNKGTRRQDESSSKETKKAIRLE